MIRCRDVSDLLLDYVEGSLEPGAREELDQHLADCPGCLVFVRTYRHTVGLRPSCLPRSARIRAERFTNAS